MAESKSAEYTRRAREKEKALIGEEEYKRKRAEYMKKYRQTEKGKQYLKEYTKANSEKNRARSKKYREDHWEEIKAKRKEKGYNEYMREYYYRNKNKIAEIKKEVEALRKELNRAEPDYELPPLPKRNAEDPEAMRAYYKAVQKRSDLKAKRVIEELAFLKQLKEKA